MEFVNNIFDGYQGWSILIDLKCRKLIEDLINQRKEMDGSKSKAKVMDSRLGIKYEKYGLKPKCRCIDFAESVKFVE